MESLERRFEQHVETVDAVRGKDGEWTAPPFIPTTEPEIGEYVRADDGTGEPTYLWMKPLADRLRERYERVPVPPCRVCGGELTIARMGGGEVTRYACSSPEAKASVGIMRGGDNHYFNSYWSAPNHPDEDVIALLRRLDAARIVADYWIASILGAEALSRTGMSHPVAMVNSALNGTLDPVELGVAVPSDAADALRALMR